MTDDQEAPFASLSIEDVLSIHEDAIDTWGGTHGVRDPGLLESAIAAARNVALYDSTADIFDIAAADGYHIAQNQPFLDGNKRAGLGAAAAFLFVNGVDLHDAESNGESVLAQAMLDVASPKGGEPRRELAAIFRRQSRR